MKHLLVKVSLAGFLLLLCSPVSAHEQWKVDWKDPGGKLDIERASLKHGGGFIRSKIVMEEAWKLRSVRWNRHISLYLNPKGGRDNGYFISLERRKGRLRVIAKRSLKDFSTVRVGRGHFQKVSPWAVVLAVRKRTVRLRGGFVRWQIQTWNGKRTDFAPNGGFRTWYHRL